MKSLFNTSSPLNRGRGFRRSMFLLISALVLPILQLEWSAPAADDPLRSKFLSKLHSVVESADAIVGVAIKDLKSGEETLINENEIFPQASSIKIHILAELYRQAESGRFRLSDVVALPESVKVGGEPILHELGRGSVSMSLRDYAIFMIVLSDNTAANFLIQLVGMENVNKSLQALGASKTKLQRVMMDVKAAAEGRENIGTPKEVMTILEKFYRGEIVNKKACEDMLSILRKPKSKEGPIKAGLPETVEAATKDGEIEGVRCDVGIVYLSNAPYIICVMTKLLLRDEDGPKIITDISRLTYQYFERMANSNQYGRRIPK